MKVDLQAFFMQSVLGVPSTDIEDPGARTRASRQPYLLCHPLLPSSDKLLIQSNID
jgi:hypothetical protein